MSRKTRGLKLVSIGNKDLLVQYWERSSGEMAREYFEVYENRGYDLELLDPREFYFYDLSESGLDLYYATECIRDAVRTEDTGIIRDVVADITETLDSIPETVASAETHRLVIDPGRNYELYDVDLSTGECAYVDLTEKKSEKWLEAVRENKGHIEGIRLEYCEDDALYVCAGQLLDLLEVTAKDKE